MKAKEMFEQLGYELVEDKKDIKEYLNSICIPNNINTEKINFTKIRFYDKNIFLESYQTDAFCLNKSNFEINCINIEELQAMNQQIKELNWND